MRQVLLSILAMACLGVSAQTHEHPKNEIALSVGANYSLGESHWLPAVCLHYFRTLSSNHKWKFGGGVESVIGENAHYNVSAGVSYSPIKNFSITVMPGINILEEHQQEHTHEGAREEETRDLKVAFILHGELVYNILTVGNFNLGPVVDISLSPNHSSLMAGIHTAYEF